MTTTGMELIRTLGLGEFTEIRINRIVDNSVRIHFIYVDSHSPTSPITKLKLDVLMPKVGAYKSPFIDRGATLPDRRILTTPLMDLKDWNGILSPGYFIVIDLAGKLSKLNRFVWEGIKGKPNSLHEDVYLSDFKKYGMSDFTQNFRGDRDTGGQREVKTAKLVDCVLNPDGSATFSWLTDVTTFASPVVKGQVGTPKYSASNPPKEVDPDTFDLIPNPSGTYTLQVQVMDVLAWLGTYPDKTEITKKDMKDILEVSSIKLWSSSPSFHWMGMNYFLSKMDGSIHPTDIAPRVWPAKHGDIYFLDKHIGGLLSSGSIEFWLNPMASMLTKRLKDAGHLK